METRTRVASGSTAIVDAMKSSTGGMTFLEGKINDLPPYTFISYEAVVWLLDQVEGITTERDAIELMEKMIDERLVCHSSGNNKLVFVMFSRFFDIRQIEHLKFFITQDQVLQWILPFLISQ